MKNKIKSHETISITIEGKARRYATIKKQYRGYLGERNAPQFPANTFVFQSLNSVIHFYYGLN